MTVPVDFRMIPPEGATEGEFLANLAPILLWAETNPGNREVQFHIVEISPNGGTISTSCPFTQVVMGQFRCMTYWGGGVYLINSYVRFLHQDGSGAGGKWAICVVDSTSGRVRGWFAKN